MSKKVDINRFFCYNFSQAYFCILIFVQSGVNNLFPSMGKRALMKILMVNKFHYVKGGSETYYFALKSLLEARGHKVIDFSMADERNRPSPYSAYFVSNKDYHAPGSLARQAALARDFVYSREARAKLDHLVRDTMPDLVHLHLFHHQLTPSILDGIKKYDLPAVYTAHDLQMLCPNYQMTRDGKACEDCLHGKVLSCVRHRCVMDSLSKSALSALEHKANRLRGAYAPIRYWIMPSQFYFRKFLEAGISEEKLAYIPNFLPQPPVFPVKAPEEKSGFLYLGRLSKEKGILTLLRAICGTDIPLRVAGTGPLEEEIKVFIQKENMKNVRLLGFLQPGAVEKEIGNARAVVLPSEWYENSSYAAIEAMRQGRPLIGSRIGGIPEQIQGNGLLTVPGSAESLRQAMLDMMNASTEKWMNMSKASLALFTARYTAESHAEKLGRVYQRLGFSL